MHGIIVAYVKPERGWDAHEFLLKKKKCQPFQTPSAFEAAQWCVRHGASAIEAANLIMDALPTNAATNPAKEG